MHFYFLDGAGIRKLLEAKNCLCDSANQTPIVEIPIIFDDTGVTMGSGDQIIRYDKASSNLYRISQDDMIAEITFLPEGWGFLATKAGDVGTI